MSPSYPLFFRSEDGLWQQPIPIYLSGLFGPFASGIVGALDVVLIYFVAAKLLKSRWAAVIAAVLLLLFPVHASFSRQNLEAVAPLPFVLAWLLCLVTFLERPRPWLLFAGGLCLGVGVYTQPSAPITMFALLIVTAGTLAISGHRAPKAFASAAAGFGVPLLLLVPWYASHPETYQDTMGTWAIHKAHIRFPIDGVRAFVNWNTLTTRASRYWGMFNPSFLLFRADGTAFTGRAPMPWPLAVLAVIGVRRVLIGDRSWVAFLLLSGVAVSPLAASTAGGPPHAIGQALAMVVFVSLLAVFGALDLIESRRLAPRVVGIALLALIPLLCLVQ